jgi:arsenate reductase (thioredoxin)
MTDHTPADAHPAGEADTQGAIELTTEQLLQIKQAAARLQLEFDGVFNAATIERYITDSQTRLGSRARINTWLPVLIERFTRDRLRALARLDVGENERPAVLFLCVHNAGRSQMAAGFLRHLAGDTIDVFSGGSDPGTQVNAAAIEAMNEVGIDISTEYPKPWTDEIARAADVIVTMGCGDACPIFPGKRYEDWELSDPAGQSVEFVRDVRDDIRSRVEQLIASLQVSA